MATMTALAGCVHTPFDGRAFPVSRIEPAEADNFEDLEPLARWVGDARVVMLGESHGDGRSLVAMSRLVRFLHARLGFDVLAFEAGFLDMDGVEEALGGNGSLTAAAELGVAAPWSEVQETQPLWSWLRALHATSKPMEVCGFDMQLTGVKRDGRRALQRLEQAFGRLGVTLDPEEHACLQDAVAGARGLAERPCAEALSDQLAIRLQSAEGNAVERAWIVQALRNISADAVLMGAFARAQAKTQDDPSKLIEVLQKDSPWVQDFRDGRMAENLLWLLEKRFRGRRIVVWAAKNHVSRLALHNDSTGRDEAMMGSIVASALGPGMRALAFTWYQGAAGVPWNEVDTDTDEPGSFEAILHAAGGEAWFVDTRQSWANEPPAGIRWRGRWSTTHDGVFFIDKMAASTFASDAHFNHR